MTQRQVSTQDICLHCRVKHECLSSQNISDGKLFIIVAKTNTSLVSVFWANGRERQHNLKKGNICFSLVYLNNLLIHFSMALGMLKSIMKRKDASNSGENRTTGKKSLQFVGILNGGWVT